MNNEDKTILKVLIGIILAIFLIYFFSLSCTNTEGKFDNAIFWTAVSSILSAIAFGGVILTLYITEESRKKQNEYEFQKEILLNEQEDFKKKCMEIFEKINPEKLVHALKEYDTGASKEILNNLVEYQLNLINGINEIVWFYSKEEWEESESIVDFKNKYNINKDKLMDFVSELVKISKIADQDSEEVRSVVEKFIRDVLNYANKDFKQLIEDMKKIIQERKEEVEEQLKILEKNNSFKLKL